MHVVGWGTSIHNIHFACVEMTYIKCMHAKQLTTKGEEKMTIDLEMKDKEVVDRYIDMADRLNRIVKVIKGIEDRCILGVNRYIDAAALKTTDEITEEEIRMIYKLAKGE